MNPPEQWAMVEGFPDYAVSNYGQVMHTRFDRLLTLRTDSYGSQRVTLYRSGDRFDFYVHHLVAQAFMSDYSTDVRIKHRNENNADNSVDNLYYRGHDEPADLIVPQRQSGPRRVRWIQGGLIFRCVEDVARHLDGDPSSIYKVLRGERGHYRGQTFEYFDGGVSDV